MTGVCCSNYLQVTTFVIQECCRQGFIIWCKRKVYLAHILMPIKEDGYNHCFKNWKDFSRGGIHSPNILMTGYLLRTLPSFRLLKDSSILIFLNNDIYCKGFQETFSWKWISLFYCPNKVLDLSHPERLCALAGSLRCKMELSGYCWSIHHQSWYNKRL